jgi:hypothetical protein
MKRQRVITNNNRVTVINSRGNETRFNLQPGRCFAALVETRKGRRERRGMWITADALDALTKLLAQGAVALALALAVPLIINSL